MRAPSAARYATIFAILVTCIACGAKTPTEPDPVYELKTETFPGTVKAGGSTAFPFTVVNPGNIEVGITALAPTSSLTMGISMGFWNAATSTCVEELSTSTATLNVFFSASPSAPGEYCAAIFDTGNVQGSSDFTLTVRHY